MIHRMQSGSEEGDALAVLVIAGSGRGAGKTAVGCALVAALPGFRWMAMKISPHGHGTGAETDTEILEEFERDSEKDSSRYLKAGADRSFFIERVPHDALVRWIAEERKRESEDNALVVESNSLDAKVLSREGEATVTLAVIAGPVADWKPTLQGSVASADALVLAAGVTPDHLPAVLQGKPLFPLGAGAWSTPALVAFVSARLTAA